MARDKHEAQVGLVVPRLYRELLEKECQRREGPDPRLFLSVDAPEQLAAWEQLKEEG